jgi:hypothetical protein
VLGQQQQPCTQLAAEVERPSAPAGQQKVAGPQEQQQQRMRGTVQHVSFHTNSAQPRAGTVVSFGLQEHPVAWPLKRQSD